MYTLHNACRGLVGQMYDPRHVGLQWIIHYLLRCAKITQFVKHHTLSNLFKKKFMYQFRVNINVLLKNLKT